MLAIIGCKECVDPMEKWLIGLGFVSVSQVMHMEYVAPPLCHWNHSSVYCRHSNNLDQNNDWYIPHCGHGLLRLQDIGFTGADY